MYRQPNLDHWPQAAARPQPKPWLGVECHAERERAQPRQIICGCAVRRVITLHDVHDWNLIIFAMVPGCSDVALLHIKCWENKEASGRHLMMAQTLSWTAFAKIARTTPGLPDGLIKVQGLLEGKAPPSYGFALLGFNRWDHGIHVLCVQVIFNQAPSAPKRKPRTLEFTTCPLRTPLGKLSNP